MDFLTDTFHDVDGTLLSAHTSDSGATWAENSNLLQIQSNSLQVNTSFSGFDSGLSDAIPPSADYQTSLEYNVTPGVGAFYFAGVGVRMSGEFGPGYYGELEPGASPPTWNIFYANGDGFLSLASGNPGVVSEGFHTLQLQVSGSTLTLVLDSAVLGSVVDATVSAAGHPYIGFNCGIANTVQYTLVTAGDFTTPPPGVPLSGSGCMSISGLGYVTYVVVGSSPVSTSGNAYPPNLYHVGLFRFGKDGYYYPAFPLDATNGVVAEPTEVDQLCYALPPGVTVYVQDVAAP